MREYLIHINNDTDKGTNNGIKDGIEKKQRQRKG